ncbi:hypothetical protein [Nocardia wallacei]|uniref:hypothetical protein n=1 Tax=Nocardia wallacei TaxID=480035 RepID=UPI002458EC19|nr:hypothetical protein [Nocardia wallacei]
MKHSRPQTAVALVAAWLVGAAILAGCGGHSRTRPAIVPVETADVHASPTNLSTTVFQGMALPVADQGPHHRDGPAATGFDHTPVGAALAAIHATVRMSVADDGQWTLVGQQMLAPGPGRDAWALARAQLSITAPAAAPVPKVLGYQVTRYTSEQAVTAIYTLQPDTSLTRNTATVAWQHGDWKLLVPDPPRGPAVASLPVLPSDLIALPLR